jgi:hypothetical protein
LTLIAQFVVDHERAGSLVVQALLVLVPQAPQRIEQAEPVQEARGEVETDPSD